MKPCGPGVSIVRSVLITDSISLPVPGLFGYSISLIRSRVSGICPFHLSFPTLWHTVIHSSLIILFNSVASVTAPFSFPILAIRAFS